VKRKFESSNFDKPTIGLPRMTSEYWKRKPLVEKFQKPNLGNLLESTELPRKISECWKRKLLVGEFEHPY
jgi:hypothetical protein